VQECFLGAVRGIAAFDPIYSFEQYLFGICRNRTIDWLRRRKAAKLVTHDEQEERALLEELARTDETPSRIVRGHDIVSRGRELLATILREWVEETWSAGEFVRLMVIEALLAGSWRNRDTWQRFGLRDETAVAGIKFRALKRLRELAAAKSLPSEVLAALADRTEEGGTGIDVGAVWREARASCPARHWLARDVAGTLEATPCAFLRFHLEEMACAWCQANRDDLAAAEADLEPLLERMHASTLRYLRSRTRPGSPPEA
jgi:hypothetical protein